MACLRFRDLVKNYSVTLPERAVAYYNLLTVEKTPAGVLEEMKAAAGEALEMSLRRISEQQMPYQGAGVCIAPRAKIFSPGHGFR
jgi:arginine utilization protein RocB